MSQKDKFFGIIHKSYELPASQPKFGWGGGNTGKIFHNVFERIITLDNLLAAWREFSRGKRKRKDVMLFEFNLEDNLFLLHKELKNGIYRHSNYTSFFVQDPKLRHIHKAHVKDRVLQQAVFRVLYQIFDPTFIFDSYSSRLEKGTHKAVNRLEKFCRKLSRNNTRQIFALKCDIRKFFDSVNHEILLTIISRRIKDLAALNLIREIIGSFKKTLKTGIPLGNVTSQLFANSYLNEFDQFVKHKLKVKHYLRYGDDFVILTQSQSEAESLVEPIKNFLAAELALKLHPQKIIIRKYFQGIDFLGYVVLPYCRLLRLKTKKRLMRKIREGKNKLTIGLISKESFNQSLQSYYGILKHCQGYKIKKKIL